MLDDSAAWRIRCAAGPVCLSGKCPSTMALARGPSRSFSSGGQRGPRGPEVAEQRALQIVGEPAGTGSRFERDLKVPANRVGPSCTAPVAA